MSLIYPRVIPIHTLRDEDCFADENGNLVLPTCIRSSFQRIQPGGAYLMGIILVVMDSANPLDNGQSLILWFKSDVSPNLLADLYGDGITALEQLDPRNAKLPELETRISIQVRNLIAYLNTFNSSRHLVPQIARERMDGSELIFAQGLVEDRNCDAMSYVDFVVYLHKQIQMELRGGKSNDGW